MSQLTQSEINDLLQQFIGTTAGQHIDYYGYAGECLSLNKRWVDVVKNGHLNGPMLAPPSSDGWGSGYWSHAPGSILEDFDVVNYDPNATYPAGSQFVNTGTHHIGIMLDNRPGSPTATVFEQNADPDGSAAHTAQRLKTHIDGILVIKVAAPAPVIKYAVIENYSPAKQVMLNKQPTNLWGMNYDFDYMKDHPVEVHNQGEIVSVTNKVHHIDGYDYYRRDGQVDGFNVADCDDYTPPVIPYVPPAAPANVQLAEKYSLVTTLVYYPTAEDAKQRTAKAVGPVFDGTYYVVKKDGQAYKLSKDNKTDIGWININDNRLPEPTPEPIQPTLPVDPVPVITEAVNVPPAPLPISDVTPAKKLWYDWIDGVNHAPVWFHTLSTTDQKIKDLENPDTSPQAILPANKDVRFSMVTIKNGMNYYIPTASLKNGYRHGVPETLLKRETAAESFLDEVESDVSDWADKLIEMPKKAYTLISDISPVSRHKMAYQAKQFIDGFKKGSKK